MKTNKLKTVIIAVVAIVLAFHSNAQESNSGTQFSVEIDPATFGFKGYGFHLRVKPASFDHMQLGVGTYAMEMPDVLVNFNENNKDKGWGVRINQAYGLFGEYYFNEVNKKFFLGTQLGVQEFKIKNDNIEGQSKFLNGLAIAYAGYSFMPFKFNLYIKPWMGVGYTTKLSGSNDLGNETYDIAPFTAFATLHLGWQF